MKEKALRGTFAVTVKVVAFVFVLAFLWGIFPVCNGEMRAWVHEKKIQEMLCVAGECEVRFAGESVQIEYKSFPADMVASVKVLDELAEACHDCEKEELLAYYAVCSTFMYLDGRKIGDKVEQVTCRISAYEEAGNRIVCLTGDQYRKAYEESPSKISRDKALLGCVCHAIRENAYK